jgi:hypothetical protein
MFFLSGTPRSSSTVLRAILAQNPDIYAGPNSPLCPLMWDTFMACEMNQQLSTSDRMDFTYELTSAVPRLYYKDVDRPIILDKSRGWTQPFNMSLILQYITDKPKIIVLTRPTEEIIDSFHRLWRKNGLAEGDPDFTSREDLLRPGSDPVMSAVEGVESARMSSSGQYLFVEYEDFIEHPFAVLDRIYKFCEWPSFDGHHITNIVDKYPETDFADRNRGAHEVRSILSYGEVLV